MKTRFPFCKMKVPEQIRGFVQGGTLGQGRTKPQAAGAAAALATWLAAINEATTIRAKAKVFSVEEARSKIDLDMDRFSGEQPMRTTRRLGSVGTVPAGSSDNRFHDSTLISERDHGCAAVVCVEGYCARELIVVLGWNNTQSDGSRSTGLNHTG